MSIQLIETYYGKFLVQPGDLISDTLIKGDFWEEDLLPIFNKYINKDSIVVEVGSYFGDHTIYLSRLAKQVIAYEGYQRNYYNLVANIFINECYNVIPLNYIIGNGGLARPADPNKNDGWCPDWSHNAAGARFVVGEGIQTYRLDDMNLDKVDFLKIDAEGMDLSIMMGGINLIRTYRPVIVFEYNAVVTQPFEEYDRFMKQINYTYEKIDTWNWLALEKGG